MTLEPYLATASGGRVYPFGPRAEDITIDDIANGLSLEPRYAGQTSRAVGPVRVPVLWSVAAHSLHMSRMLDRQPELAFAALLHDASEAYLRDIPAPIKPLFLNYDIWSRNIEQVIAKKFGVAYPWDERVHRLDKAICRIEVYNFFPPGSDAWKRYEIALEDSFQKLTPLSPIEAHEQFITRFAELTHRLGRKAA